MTDPEILKYIDKFCVKTGDVEVKDISYDGLVTLTFPVFNGEQGIDQTATIELEFSYDGEEVTLHKFPNNLLPSEDYIYAMELVEQTMQQEQEFRQLAEKYGFTTTCKGSKLYLCANDTDHHRTAWISYDSKTDTVSCLGNTDQLNIWLCDTRKDMIPERCIAFVSDLNSFFALNGENKFSVRELIDPEDWQEIAHVKDAFEDERYTVGDQKTFSEQVQALTHVDDYTKKLIEESVAKKQSIDFRLVEPLLYDDLGNRKAAFEVNVFDKASDGSWHQTEQLTTLSGSFYVLGDAQNRAVFSEINGRLYPMNMDFYSRDCHRCYGVGKEIPVTHKITGNAILAELKSQNGAVYRLKRQDYSDTPPFYYFANSHGDFRVNHGNHDLKELFGVLKRSFSHDPVLSDTIAKLEDSMCHTARSSLDSKIQSASHKAGKISAEQELLMSEGR